MSQDTREEWRPIAGFPNYQVSNKGKVMNLKTGRVLKNKIDGHGYAFVALCKGDGKPKNIKVHKLVAKTFIPNPDNLPQINHKNEKKDDNNVENLEWCSRSYNVAYSSHKRSCKIKQITKDGKSIRIWDSVSQIVKELGYDISAIVKVLKGKRRSAYSFKWEYADPSQQRKFNRPVAALTKDGDLIAEYKSAAEASRCLNISEKCIHLCLNGTYKSTHGLRFIYID